MDVAGDFDYDGFYRFSVRLAPQRRAGGHQPVLLGVAAARGRRHAHGGPRGMDVEGLARNARASSMRRKAACGTPSASPSPCGERKGNMPPFCWVGDDDRGVCFSCASDQGMHNDDALPAADDRSRRPGGRLSRLVRQQAAEARQAAELRVRLAGQPLQADRSGPPPVALRRFAKRLLLRAARPIFPYGLGHRLLLADLRAFSRSGEERRGDPPRAAERIRLYRRLGLVLLGMRRHARVQAVLAGVGQRVGLGQDAAGPLAGVDGEAHAGLRRALRSVRGRWKARPTAARRNVDYRAWWFQQVARHCQTSMIYQDNPPYGYFYQPAVGYGYTRDDGVREPTCATWNARQFMRRALHVAVESGTDNPAPGVYPNVCGSAQPGRSFCFRGLNGEYLESDRLPLGTLRVWCSQAVGHEHRLADAGAQRRRHAEVLAGTVQPPVPAGRDLLLPLGFGRPGGLLAGGAWTSSGWMIPTLAWHPYFRNPIVKSTLRPTTLVSAYTAKRPRAAGRLEPGGRRRRGNRVLWKTWRSIGGGGVKHYYDAETGEEIETPREGAVRLYVPGNDYRLVLGFPQPWPFAAKHAVRRPDLPAQSSLDPRRTLTALCRQLLAATEALARRKRAPLDRSLGAGDRRPVPVPIRRTSSISTPRPAATSIWATRTFRRPCSTTSSGRCCWSCTSIPRRPTAC